MKVVLKDNRDCDHLSFAEQSITSEFRNASPVAPTAPTKSPDKAPDVTPDEPPPPHTEPPQPSTPAIPAENPEGNPDEFPEPVPGRCWFERVSLPARGVLTHRKAS